MVIITGKNSAQLPGLTGQLKATTFKIQVNPLQNFFKQRFSAALKSSEAFKNMPYTAGTVSGSEAGLSTTVTVTKTPALTEPLRTVSAVSGYTGPAAPFKVTYVKSDNEIVVDVASNIELRNLVFPGAVVNANNILNGNYSDGLSSPLPVLPVNLFTTMVPLQAGQTSSRTIQTPSGVNVKNALNELYLQNAQGGTNSPSIQLLDAYIVESNNQWKAESNHTFDAGINRSISVPVEAINIKLGGGVGGGSSSSTTTSLQQQTSFAVLTYKHIYYSASIEPVQPSGTVGASGRFFNMDAATIPANLLYIRNVDYGRLVYVVISAKASREDLAYALKQKFNIGIEGGIGIPQAGIEAEIDDGAEAMREVRMNRVLQNSEMKFRAFMYGGNAVSPVDLLFNANEIINAPDGSDAVILNKILSRVNITYSTNNVPLPIGFSCRFAKDGATAWFNTTANYYSETVTARFRYDVQLELDQIQSVVCKDLDETEDIYGQLKFTWFKAGDRQVNEDKVFWEESENNANTNPVRKGSSRSVKEKKLLITGLKLDELLNATLFVGGKLQDDEGVLGSRDFRCINCQEFSGDNDLFGKRKIYFSELTTTRNSVLALPVNDNNLHPLSFGSDKTFELQFFESGKRDDGYVKVVWKLNVKAYTIN
ncbi:MAG: thiol-activated cytolysin family protein [Chitinophagaceae bacterium]|nr:thiol-activated cytolysin family protein [Chitinophagaceae bacterium]